jgi:ferredoxin
MIGTKTFMNRRNFLSKGLAGMASAFALPQFEAIRSTTKKAQEEKAYLKLARINHQDSLICQGCGTCLKQCSKAPDIPTLMRCYMYAYGYRDLPAAVRNIKSVDNPIACADCASCVVECPMGYDIKEKALDIIRLRDVPLEFFV